MSYQVPKFIRTFPFILLCGAFLFIGPVGANPVLPKAPIQKKIDVQIKKELSCPVGFKASKSEDLVYCIKSKIVLPKAKVEAKCSSLSKGQIGFSWVPSTSTLGYTCPTGAQLVKQDQTHLCLFEGLKMPKNAKGIKPYCHFLDKGYFGFSYTP